MTIKPDQPNDANDYDGSHISKPVREALKDQPPEIAAGVRRVADADKTPTRKN